MDFICFCQVAFEKGRRLFVLKYRKLFNRRLKDCLEKTGKILFSKTGKNSDTRLLQKLNTRQVSVEEFTV